MGFAGGLPEPDTPDTAGGDEDALLPKFITGAGLTESRIVKGHLYDSCLDGRIYPVLKNGFAAADFLQGCLAACVVQFFDSVEAIAAIAYHFACLGYIA